MNQFDQRQLNIMIEKIKGFEEGKLHISDLIYDLEGLLNILQKNDLNWKKKFRMHWADLEITFAFALENESFKNNKIQFNKKEMEIINEAVKNLKKIIEIKLDSGKYLTSDSE